MSFLSDVLARDGAARDSAAERLGAERFRDMAGGRPEGVRARSLAESVADDFRAGAPDAHAEAVVLFDVRPSLLIRDDGFEAPASPVWRDRLTAAMARLRAAIPSVGRIETANHPHPMIAGLKHVGTAWMIADGIAVTNRHVALLLGFREGDRVRLWSDGLAVRIDFLEESERTAARETAVARIGHIAEDADHDMALLVLDKGAGLPPPLPLDDHRADEFIVTIGYPARDGRVPEDLIRHIFNGVYDVKRLAPGMVMPGGAGGVLFHDASTLKGSSGSVCVSQETGRAIGLHFAGEFNQKNFAVSARALKERLAALNVAVPVAALRAGARPAASAAENVGERDGYRADFLAEGAGEEKRAALAVPLPGENHPDALKLADGSTALPYTHFSVVMHAERRLAICAAVNIDGRSLRRIPRGDRFMIDGRIPTGAQFDDALYRDNVYDRGHLVRRLDPVWGDEATAAQANDDSFFFTNIAPQHEMLNQKLWAELEDYVLDNADAHDLRVSVFTGCVFDPADPDYRGAKIPREFWKIVAFRDAATDRLRASGYLLDQSALVRDVQESFAFGAFKTYQLSIDAIARRTGLDLAGLAAADVVAGAESFALAPLQRLSDIRL